MQRDINGLQRKKFDILIIGGGITGACIAHDAALRGMSVALVEKNDFSSFTSSASSKLLHGGIRYLPKFQLKKIRESAREQTVFQHLAPHLTHWVPFLVPTKKGSFIQGSFAMKVAMFIYRLLCTGLKNLIRDPAKKAPSAQFYSPDELFRLVPFLGNEENITGAQELWESHMYSSERMVLAFIKTAVANGAMVANHTEALEMLMDGPRVTGIQAKDVLTGEAYPIRAELVINAAGPYVQAVNKSIPSLQLKKKITGFSRGVHLVTRQVESEYALALTTRKKTEGLVTRGGRHFFIIPWRDRSLIGTTNVPYAGNLDDIKVTEKDITDFLEEINEAAPQVKLKREDVYYSFTGLYPLISKEIKKDTYQGTGEYQIIDHAASDNIDGIITALGAKYTTARFVAEKTVDLATGKVSRMSSGCRTVVQRLKEGDIPDLRKFEQCCYEKYGVLLDEDVIEHLIRYHGTEIEHIVTIGHHKDMLHRLSNDTPTLEIEVYYAVEDEMARTLEDVVFRRTGLGTKGQPDRDQLTYCAAIMGDMLNWSKEEKERQVQTVLDRYQYSKEKK